METSHKMRWLLLFAALILFSGCGTEPATSENADAESESGLEADSDSGKGGADKENEEDPSGQSPDVQQAGAGGPLRYVADGYVAAGYLKVESVVANEVVAKILAVPEVSENFRYMPLNYAEIKSVVAMASPIDQPIPKRVTSFEELPRPKLGMVVTFKDDKSAQQTIDKMQNSPESVETVTWDGFTYSKLPPAGPYFHVAEDKHVLIISMDEPNLQQMLKANQADAPSALSKKLASLAQDSELAFVYSAPTEEVRQQVLETIPLFGGVSSSKRPVEMKRLDADGEFGVPEPDEEPEGEPEDESFELQVPTLPPPVVDVVQKTASFELQLSLAGKTLVNLDAQTVTPEAAAAYQEMLNSMLADSRIFAQGIAEKLAERAASETVTAEQKSEQFQDVVRQSYEAVKITNNEANLSLKVTAPEYYAELPQLMDDVMVAIEKENMVIRDMNNLHQIGIAMHMARSKGLSITPAISKDGKELMSWRVGLLNFLETGSEFGSFDLRGDEPWDSEFNRKFADETPEVYSSVDTPKGKTRFLMLTGEGTAFPTSDTPLSLRATLNRPLFIAVGPDKAVPWSKPEELKINWDDPYASFGQPNLQGGWAALFVDGHVEIITPEKYPPEKLKELLAPKTD